jgi:hypothetical protein
MAGRLKIRAINYERLFFRQRHFSDSSLAVLHFSETHFDFQHVRMFDQTDVYKNKTPQLAEPGCCADRYWSG